MRRLVRANSKCPICGSEAYTSFMTTECTRMFCENYKEGVVTKSEYDLLESKSDAEGFVQGVEQSVFEWYKDQAEDYSDDTDDDEEDESKD